MMTGVTTLKEQKAMVTRFLNDTRRALERGRPVAARDWLTLGNEYQREENAFRDRGVPEDELRINRQTIINDFFSVSEDAGKKVRKAIGSE